MSLLDQTACCHLLFFSEPSFLLVTSLKWSSADTSEDLFISTWKWSIAVQPRQPLGVVGACFLWAPPGIYGVWATLIEFYCVAFYCRCQCVHFKNKRVGKKTTNEIMSHWKLWRANQISSHAPFRDRCDLLLPRSLYYSIIKMYLFSIHLFCSFQTWRPSVVLNHPRKSSPFQRIIKTSHVSFPSDCRPSSVYSADFSSVWSSDASLLWYICTEALDWSQTSSRQQITLPYLCLFSRAFRI